MRTIIALAAQHELKLYQMDVTTAFLNGELREEVYMKQPEGFIAKRKGTPSLQVKSKHLWAQTITTLLELCT